MVDKKNIVDNNITTNSTYQYKNENEYVMALPRVVAVGEVKIFHPNSIFWLLFKKFNSLKILKSYIKQVIINFRWLIKLKKIKDSNLTTEAIVIGNGPSQGFLEPSRLREFKAKGGQILCINFWTMNEDLCSIIPTYMVTSDPIIFSNDIPIRLKEKHEKLMSYMLKNVSIKIFCPLERCNQLAKIFGEERVIGFVDQELRMWTRNLNPMYPRGYVSMTLYKALAVARWINYRKIYVIGMDNTYPRNLYCDQDNKIINHELHASEKDFSVDQSSLYKNVGDSLTDIAQIFYDAKKFAASHIVNLDPYSLTDVFHKAKPPIEKISDNLMHTCD